MLDDEDLSVPAQALNRELMELNEDLEQHNLKWSQAVDALNAIG